MLLFIAILLHPTNATPLTHHQLTQEHHQLFNENQQLFSQFIQLQSSSTKKSASTSIKLNHPLTYCNSDNLYCEKESDTTKLIPCEETLYMNEQLEMCRDSFVSCTTSWYELFTNSKIKLGHNLLREWKTTNNITAGPDIPSKLPKPIQTLPLPPLLKQKLPHTPKQPKPAQEPILVTEEKPVVEDVSSDVPIAKINRAPAIEEQEEEEKNEPTDDLPDLPNSPELILKKAKEKDRHERMEKMGLSSSSRLRFQRE